MDMQTQIAQTVALVLATVLTAVVSWTLAQVRAHVTDARMRNALDVLVQGAEQMFKGQDGQKKMNWVQDIALQKFPRVDPQILRAVAEASVRGLDAGLVQGQAAPLPAPGAPIPALDKDALVQEILMRVISTFQASLLPPPSTPPNPQ